MLGRWIRDILARSLYNDVKNCRKCERADGGFDNWDLCPVHEMHIEFCNFLTSFREPK